MFLICLFLLLSAQASGVDYYDEGRSCAEELMQKHRLSQNEEKESLRKTLTKVKKDSLHPTVSNITGLAANKCSINAPVSSNSETGLYIFVSFSMSDDAWLLLSKEVEKTEGILVLRGLPNNSFKQLAEKLFSLRQQGMKATVQVDPRLFQKYTIEKVPCFVTINKEVFDKLSGNVSLAFALTKMNNETAKYLRSLL